ncbi:MAG: DUF4249 domain-containing protein [Filimonas sp.]|nr:DUF4249 domain-containing protein [Filimonas sp.]
MKKILLYSLLILSAGILLNACKDVYKPQAISTPNRYLVVEGFINGTDSTFFRLSRSRNIGDTGAVKYETAAQVSIEGSNGGSFSMTNKGSGLYALGVSPFDFSSKYRLRIKTGGKEYLSEYVVLKKSPPIDSVSYSANSDGVRIYVTSHDPAGATRYYKWDYVETWEYTSLASSSFMYTTAVVPRPDPNEFYRCWRTDRSSTINLATSNGLATDIAYKAPLQYIDGTSFKVSIRYSILVNQTVLTEDAFNYWSTLKKTSESLGSIFDPQPSQLKSNIACITTPNEPVIGYVSGSTNVQKRIFINKADLPNYRPIEYALCIIDSFFFTIPGTPPIPPGRDNDTAARMKSYFQGNSNIILSDFYFGSNPKPAGYLYSSKDCMDCREKGGVTQKPAFW